MQSLILQDWVTIRGQSSVTSVVQGEDAWLDMAPYQDVVAWLHVSEISNTVTLTYETAPTLDEALFQSTVSGFALSVGVTVTPIIMTLATNPLARFLRWRLSGSGGTWDATFRVFLAANPPLLNAIRQTAQMGG